MSCKNKLCRAAFRQYLRPGSQQKFVSLRSVQAAKPDPAAFLDGNREFHQIIMTVAQSPRLASTLATLVEQPVVRRTAALYNREQLAQSATEHRELIRAFAARDADWAHAVMTGHIRRAFHTFSGLVVADVP